MAERWIIRQSNDPWIKSRSQPQPSPEPRAEMKGALMRGTGVDYSPRHGARCPQCGADQVPKYKTMPWDDSIRVRYHRCNGCGCRFKSIQSDI